MMPPVGKSGPFTHFSSALDSRVGLLDQMQRGFAELGRIVRRDRGRHADRDALRAVGEQVRKAAGQHARLFGLAVIVRTELDTRPRRCPRAGAAQTSVMRASV